MASPARAFVSSTTIAKEFLSKAAAENSVSPFLDRLEQVNDVYSHSLCQALHRSWHSLIVSYTVSTGSPSSFEEDAVNSLVEGSTSICQNECESGRLWAEIALDFTWRKLNSNHWKDVELIWREAYATAALFKALSLLREGQVKEALIETDKGILLGAPVFDDILKRFASTLTNELQKLPQTSDKQDRGTLEANNFPLDGDSDLGQTNTCKSEVRKVVFRNYSTYCTSLSHDMNIPTHLHCSTEGSPSVDPATIPLIDMTRRVAVVNCPSLEEFYHNHMMSSTSVVISGAMDHWPACTTRKWRYIHQLVQYTIAIQCMHELGKWLYC